MKPKRDVLLSRNNSDSGCNDLMAKVTVKMKGIKLIFRFRFQDFAMFSWRFSTYVMYLRMNDRPDLGEKRTLINCSFKVLRLYFYNMITNTTKADLCTSFNHASRE
jgi:hypothetical protein